MARKLLLLNLFLALAVTGLGMQLVRSWQEFENSHSIEQLMAGVQSQPPRGPDQAPPLDVDQQPSYLDYQLIAEKNLFAEDRQPPQPEDVGAASDTAPALNPEPILHGTLTVGNRRAATITKYEGTGRRRVQGSKVRVSIGDVVQGYTVSEITSGAIVLKWNDTEVVIEKELGGRPEAPRRQIARGSGVNIIRIGAPVTAVETTSPTNPVEQQESGLTVSRTGLAQSQAQGRRGGVASRARDQAGANAQRGVSNSLRGRQSDPRRNESQTPRRSSASITPGTSGSRPPR